VVQIVVELNFILVRGAQQIILLTLELRVSGSNQLHTQVLED